MTRSPYRRPSSLRRGVRSHPGILAAGLACAAIVVLALGFTTSFFGLLHPPTRGGGPGGPDLNPYGETILAVVGSVTGPNASDFTGVDGVDLCLPHCPELPTEFNQPNPPEVGIYFFLNVTDTAGVTATLSVPSLGTSGSESTLFALHTYCCYTGPGIPYPDLMFEDLKFTSATPVGLEGYAYSIVDLPPAAGGGYTLYFNVTATGP